MTTSYQLHRREQLEAHAHKYFREQNKLTQRISELERKIEKAKNKQRELQIGMAVKLAMFVPTLGKPIEEEQL